MMWCYDQDRIKAYISHHLPCPSVPSVAIGLKKQGYDAAALYFNYEKEHGSIEMTFVSTNPANCTRRVINGFLAYPFTQLGCVRVNAHVRASNKRCRRLLKFIGFKEEGVKRLGYRGKEDIILCGLLRNDYPHLPEKKENFLLPEDITPIHKVRSLKKVESIVNSMKRRGWIGSPIPVLSTDRNYAMTGTHRIAAAREAGIMVKVHYVDTNKFTEEIYLKALRDAGDFITADLIEEELSKGNMIHGRTISTKTPASP